MKRQYGAKKGERVFYASRNAGKIKGVEKTGPRHQTKFKKAMDKYAKK